MRKCESKSDAEQVIKALKSVDLFDKINSLKNGIYPNIPKEFDQDTVIFSGRKITKKKLL